MKIKVQVFTNSVCTYTLYAVRYILKYVDGKNIQNKTVKGLFKKILTSICGQKLWHTYNLM